MEVAEEILLCNESSDENRCVTSTSGAWSYIHSLLREMDLADDKANGETFESRSIQHGLLCAMLCHAVSNDCEKQSDYVARIVGMTDRPDVQHEIMRIIQENAGQGSGSSITSNDVDDNTGDYSVLMNESAMNLSAECGYGCDNEDVNDSTTDGKRGRGYDEAFGDNGCESELLQEKKRHHAGDDDDSYFQELAGNQCNTQKLEKELNELRSANMKLQQELNETRQKELDLSLKVDELESQHRVEMLRVETESLRTIKHHEDKHNSELSDLNTELETLRECKQSSVELKEEVTRLKDELDVVQFSKEKLAFAEEQLRKCREKIELMGDAQDALGREEKAHAASVEKCIILENELSLMKPLKRQLEEYKMRADDAEVALEECRDDLRRLKEKSSGLEGANMALKRGASLQQAETGDLQKRLQEEGGKGQRGTAVGLGMRYVKRVIEFRIQVVLDKLLSRVIVNS